MGSTPTHVLHGHNRLPESRPGRWAVALAGVSVLAIVLLAVGLGVGLLESAESLTSDWLLLGWGLVMLGAGAGSVVTGVVAVTRHHERSAVVLVATFVGLLVTLVTLGEVAQGL